MRCNGVDNPHAQIQFRCRGLNIRFELKMPDADDYPTRRRRQTRRVWDAAINGYRQQETVDHGTAYDAEVRRLFRALALVIKAKLEAVESGISVFEEEFLSHIVVANGETIGKQVVPQLAEPMKPGNRLLPAIGGTRQ